MARVLLDLNLPAFQAQLFALDAAPLRQVLKALQKLSKMEWPVVYQDHGLKWEALEERPGKFSFRISQQCRAVALRDGNYLRIQSLHFDHDSAYGKK